jgi:hypothetical protein
VKVRSRGGGVQSPKSKVQSLGGVGRQAAVRLLLTLFGFRISDFLRVSDFGFRALFAASSLLAAQPLLSAATDANDEIPPLRPPHAEIPPSFWDQYSFWVILAAILVIALAGVAVWLLTRPKPPVMVPPEVVARIALEQLRHQPEDGLLLSRVSQILRHYIVTAFGMPPGELTTAEFCRAIASHEQVGPALAAALSDFLRLCDHDKFSPPTPVPPLNAAARALKLIDLSQARASALAHAAANLPPKIPPPSIPTRT